MIDMNSPTDSIYFSFIETIANSNIDVFRRIDSLIGARDTTSAQWLNNTIQTMNFAEVCKKQINEIKMNWMKRFSTVSDSANIDSSFVNPVSKFTEEEYDLLYTIAHLGFHTAGLSVSVPSESFAVV